MLRDMTRLLWVSFFIAWTSPIALYFNGMLSSFSTSRRDQIILTDSTGVADEPHGETPKANNGSIWIKNPVEGANECFDFRKYADRVVRVSLGAFLNRGEGRPHLPLLDYIPETASDFPSIGVEPTLFSQIGGVEKCSAIFFHNYKCGGTTVIKSNIKGSRRIYMSKPGRYHRILSLTERSQQSHLNNTHNNANEGKIKYPVRVFSFVRDPVDRFVSALRQVYQLGRCLSCRKCYKANKHLVNKTSSHPVIECLLDTFEQHLSYLDRHFTPQVYTLYYSQQVHDLEIDLMNLSEVSPVLEGLGRNSANTTAPAVANINSYTAKGMNLTKDAVLNDELLARICSMYHVDVLLLEKTGLATTPCSLLNVKPWIPTIPSVNIV